MLPLVRLLLFISEHEMKPLHSVCGIPYLRFIANVQSPIRTFGKRMKQFYVRKRHPWSGHRNRLLRATEERFNNTLKQRVSRLARKTLSNSYVIRQSHWGNLIRSYAVGMRTKRGSAKYARMASRTIVNFASYQLIPVANQCNSNRKKARMAKPT